MKNELKQLIDSGARVTFSWDDFFKSYRIEADWDSPDKRCGVMVAKEVWELDQYQPALYLHDMKIQVLK